MKARERFHAILRFEPVDRLPLLEWAPWWDKTIERWHAEGLPAELNNRYDICRHFGLDIYRQDRFIPRTPTCPQAVSHGAGIIENEAEYERIREQLFPEDPVNAERWGNWAEEQRHGDVVLWFMVDGFFWFPRTLLGIERHLFAFYDQPELMHRINQDLCDWILMVVDRVCGFCTPDFMTFAEDMSYNNGPMLSRELFDEFMRPYYNRVVPVLRKCGILPIVDSDGDITHATPWFETAGIGGMLPLERQSGVDIGTLRANHPDMVFIGHFDKMTMNQGEVAMRNEFERLLPTAVHGGFLPSCDHQTPPGVSYEDYLLYLDLYREYAEKAGTARHRPY